ncbi:MAG: nicotinate-nucleotide adenylyltransferase [Lachnospiraceae bacterium]
MSKIGIMGGTFNPIHLGHIGIANAAYQQFHLDEVWFMPNHLPAYKNEKEVLTGEIRMEMIRLAIQDYPYFSLSDYEMNRTGKTYTYETLLLLSKDYPHNDFYFIMGADSLFYFEQWKHPEIIVRYAKILVAVRNDKGEKEINNKIMELNHFYQDTIFFPIKTKQFPCSSSKIREIISQSYEKPTDTNTLLQDTFLNKKVYEYIKQKKIYKK